MRSFKLLFLIITAAFLTVSCGMDDFITGGTSDSDDTFTVSYSPADCTEAGQIAFVYKYMHDAYFWADEAPELDYSTYTSQYDLIDDLKVSEDRYSYIYTQSELEDYYAGNSVGLGVALSVYGDRMFVKSAIPGSPAALAGLKRGYEIISVNGYSAADMIADSDVMDTAFGASEAGLQDTIVYNDYDSVQNTVVVTKASYYSNSVYAYNIFTDTSNGKKIGYISYNSFDENTDDLTDAFKAFAKNNVKEAIIDLRNNGGGLVDTAQYFASQLAGKSLTGDILLNETFNSNYTKYNKEVRFLNPAYLMNLDKIVFLVSGNTASASELVINGFSPYKNIYLIGDTTYGKNVGMTYYPYCDKYMSAITFKNSNALGFSDYSSGFAPDCYKYDDPTSMKDYGDADEKLIAAGISYLETGTCTPDAKAKTYTKQPTIDSLGRDTMLK